MNNSFDTFLILDFVTGKKPVFIYHLSLFEFLSKSVIIHRAIFVIYELACQKKAVRNVFGTG